MSTLFIMSGLPFSGKSTLSKEISQHLGIKRISFDEVWVNTPNIPGDNDIEKWQYISRKCEDLVVTELLNNRGVVYDNLGDRFEHRQRMRQLAINNHADFKLIYINISKEEVIKRRAQNILSTARHQVSDFDFNNALNSFEIPTPSENPIIFTPDQNVEEWIKTNLT